MGNRFTYNLNELSSMHVSIAGGKGAPLGELIRAGVLVPPGFVVTSQAFESFLNAADQERQVEALFQKLDSGERTVGQVAEQLTSHFAQAHVPNEVVDEILAASRSFNNKRVSVAQRTSLPTSFR